MARSREKYNYAIKLEFREGFGEMAQRDFLAIERYINRRRPASLPVKTVAKPKTGEQQYDEFLIVVG